MGFQPTKTSSFRAGRVWGPCWGDVFGEKSLVEVPGPLKNSHRKMRMDGFEIQSPYQSSLTSLFGGCMKRVRAALLFLGNQPENGRKRCAEVGGSNHKGRVTIELIMSGSQIHQIPVRSQKRKTPVSLLQFQ